MAKVCVVGLVLGRLEEQQDPVDELETNGRNVIENKSQYNQLSLITFNMQHGIVLMSDDDLIDSYRFIECHFWHYEVDICRFCSLWQSRPSGRCYLNTKRHISAT